MTEACGTPQVVGAPPSGMMLRELYAAGRYGGTCLTESVYEVVLHESISAQIRQLMLYDYLYKELVDVNVSFMITDIQNQLANLCGNRLFQNDVVNIFCQIKSCEDVPVRSHGGAGTVCLVISGGGVSTSLKCH